MSVEALAAATAVLFATFLGGLAGVLYQLAPHNPRRITLRARYRRGRHHHPRLWARLLDAYLAGARDMAAAHALLRGVRL